jgi:PIN domain nuclease of toxin-antitoxin system
VSALLLDSHVALWALEDSDRLGPRARSRLLDQATTSYVSAATTWELQLKRGLGKLSCPADLEQHLLDAGFSELPIRYRHTQALDQVALPHRDPFDRMLLTQALVEGLTLLTADSALLDGTWDFVLDARK